jgi:biotin carboxylase
MSDVDVIIPVHEDALVLRRFESLLPPNIVLACPTLAQLERTLDKSRFLELAESCGVPIPLTRRPTTLDEVHREASAFPGRIVVKSRTGNSGRGVAVVPDANAAAAVVSEVVSGSTDVEWPLLQHYVAGQVHGSCFLASRGRVLSCFTERYLRCKEGGFGTSVYRESCESPSLVRHTKSLVEALGWTGIGHFDFIVPADGGEPRLLEMNPRPWGALKLAVAHGYNFPVAFARQSLGEPPE